MTSVTVAVDVMGGDFGPSVTIAACARALKKQSDLNLILVGDDNQIKRYLRKYKLNHHQRLRIVHATEVVGMDEPPAQALRYKKDSSMRVAINLVKEQQAQACVSAGNTGALMATARFVLKTLPGIDRPAIMALLPTMQQGHDVRVLDLGANVDSKPENLLQFALMGSLITRAVDNKLKPKVGLLNIGEEAIKGNEMVKQAAELLEAAKDIHYIGYVEGDAIYKGVADVVVCDGFVGNVALKSSEGLARLIMQVIKDAFGQNLLTKLSGLAAMHVLRKIGKRMDPGRYNGAAMIGLQGIVIKSHGHANSKAFANAILVASKQVEKNIPGLIGDEVAKMLED